jgi:hypothetical protein
MPARSSSSIVGLASTAAGCRVISQSGLAVSQVGVKSWDARAIYFEAQPQPITIAADLALPEVSTRLVRAHQLT